MESNLSESLVEDLQQSEEDFEDSGNLYLIVGPSGAGKTTMLNGVFKQSQKLCSVTTREPRKGEVDGEDYYFITKEQYEELDKSGELIQKADYVGHKYGVTKTELHEKLHEGDAVISVIIDAYWTYKNLFPQNTIGIFLNITREEIERRLDERNDGAKIKAERLAQYDIDIKNKAIFEDPKNGKNYVIDVTDDTIEANQAKLRKIVEANKRKI